MARLPDVTDDAPGVDAELMRRMAQRRGGRLLNLDRQLLHSAAVASGWNTMFGAIRTGCALNGVSRELAILLVAVINRAPYEFAQHAPVALADGVTPAQIDAVAHWRGSALFDARQQAVLAYTEAMTRQVQVDDAVFDALRQHFDAREIVELTATVAGYNMVSRFLEALRIEIESD